MVRCLVQSVNTKQFHKSSVVIDRSNPEYDYAFPFSSICVLNKMIFNGGNWKKDK